MKKILAVLFCLVSYVSFGQVYQILPQYGYESKRYSFDTTLQIPTVCGVPTLRSNVTKKAAIAFDSCNNRFYQYNPKTLSWSIIGGGFDSTSLSNRINLKLDSVTKSSDSVYYWRNGTRVFAYKDSDVIPTLQQVTDAGNTITSGGETMTLSHNLLQFQGIDNINSGQYTFENINYTSEDRNATFIPIPTTGGHHYYLYDTTTTFETDTIATLDDIRNNKIDTTGAFLISVSQPNDSTLTFQKGATATSYTIRSSVAGSATRLATSVYNNSGSTIPKGSVIYINGRHSSNLPTIALAQANNEQNSYTTFALVENDITNNSSGIVIQAGNITNLNLPTSNYTDGQVLYLSPTVAGGYTNTKPLAPNHIVKLGTVTRAHPTFGTIELKIENGWQLDELSDVSISAVPADSVLLQFSRVDSLWHDVTVTNAIGNRYIRPADTSVFERKQSAAYTFRANNTNATANMTDQVFRDPAIQTYTGTPTWTGTTAPSGTNNFTYNWTRIGNLVTLNITLTYGTAGTALTQVLIPLPTDCPTPKEPTGFGAASDFLYPGIAYMSTSLALAGANSRAGLRVNAADNGYEVIVAAASGNFRSVFVTVQYFVN